MRPHATDARETEEPLGARIWLEMRRIVGQRTVQRELHRAGRYGNTVATGHVGRTDVATEIVRRGWARAWPHYGRPYVADEAVARAAGRRAWAPAMEDPETDRWSRDTRSIAAASGVTARFVQQRCDEDRRACVTRLDSLQFPKADHRRRRSLL